MMKKTIWLMLMLVITSILNGCVKEEPKDFVGIRGEIKGIYLSGDGTTITGFLVEGQIQEDTMYDSADVSIDEDTLIYRGEEEAAIEDLEEGMKVEIIFKGPVAESYPVQGVAEKIIILED